MAALPPVHMVYDAMILAGVNDADDFHGQTSAERLSKDLFDNDSMACMDKTYEDLEQDFKSLSSLTIAQGQIRLEPRVKKRIKAFIQWTRDEVRLGRDASLTPFPVATTATLIRRYNTHIKFIRKSITLSDAAKPIPFTKDIKWTDWVPSFLNYLRTIPGRDGHPIKYICREHDASDPTPNLDFLDNYVLMAPNNGAINT